ncbi:uncharacterized protein LOC100378094 [Saccoglossus kowalevskii]|uniref:Biogenesis of lysosome-related organelles complex 1 subunit 3 n=1 Tax=Saccoglossus kowalevskii TaxID=10224 RepID=A0ABM0GZG0_SACKO|nr:PREDICTED: biogenesis of lysosome-related organelles complex 1 subunit 3-like [Saccoglossus kowalevskii]
MATKEVVRVVEGEASESESEEEINTSHHQLVGLVVAGEASETDSEDEDSVKTGSGLPPLKVKHGSPGDSFSFGSSSGSEITVDDSKPRRKEISKYDTLLHRRLRERNAALRNHLESAVNHTYQSGTRDINNTTQQLAKSQMYIQDVSHNLRVLSSDLQSLKNKVDIVMNCNILPTLHVPDNVMQNHRLKQQSYEHVDDATTRAYTMAM